MASTRVPIQTITVGAGGQASIDLSNIPQTYSHLALEASLRDNRSGNNANDFIMRANGVTTGYSNVWLQGSGSGTPQSSIFGNAMAGIVNSISGQANTFGSVDILIPNYTRADYKVARCETATEGNSTGQEIWMIAWKWDNTAAITSLSLSPNNAASWLEGSTVTLYGIASFVEAAGPKALGGTIYTDSTYAYHVFKSTGMFTPSENITADILVIAGGGGGGGGTGAGGGGAGGMLELTSQSLTSGTRYSVLVGGGGAAGWSATNGSNSRFGALTAAIGGGYGASQSSGAGASGGSGGGGQYGGSTSGGAGTSGQGNAGGQGIDRGGNSTGGGGGGGKGATGSAPPNTSVAGDGGVGATSTISGGSTTGAGHNVSGSYYFAGGGGGAVVRIDGFRQGGAGGNGGGGLGGGLSGTSGQPGAANTGGGGGGHNETYPAETGNGGSGIVIVRYAK